MDILLTEQNSGGDFIYLNNDLVAASLYENMPYLAMFGGDDWFMNDLLETDDSTKFLCRTEKMCRETPLTSEGRLIIENGVIADLQFLTENIPASTLTVNVLIVGNDRIQINVVFNGRLFSFLISTKEVIPVPIPTPPVSPVTSGLIGYYDPTGITGAGGYVDTWTDLSGTGNDIPYLSGNKAFINPAAFGGVGGLYFNGSVYKTLSNFIGLSTTGASTIYIVSSFGALGGNQGVLSYGSGTGSILITQTTIPTLLARLTGNVGINLSSVATAINQGAIYEIVIDSAQPAVSEVLQTSFLSGGISHVSGASSGSNNSGNFGNFQLTIGTGGAAMTGIMGTAMIFNRVLSGPEKILMETYLRTRFNIN